LADEEIKEFLNKMDLPEVTEKSVTDKKVLLSQVNEIRERKYAVSIGEKITGAMCVSAPIENYRFPSALSILGPEIRVKPRTADIVNELKRSATRISNNVARAFEKGDV
jgi:DNA-binding IclR family transcriptional regulator